jgi:hypothetical protein
MLFGSESMNFGFCALPDAGDYAGIDNSNDISPNAGFSGKARSRLFHYPGDRTEDACIVNIVACIRTMMSQC